MTKTPGQIAHDAGKFDRQWRHMGAAQKAEWEQIAQAVIDAQQVTAAYDQQALELCECCGWKAIMPGDPCFVCNMQTAAPAWTATADKMPEPCMNVLAHCGKKQPIRAMWVPAKTLEASGDGDFGEYDEATDEMWWPEGWYETNAFEETHWLVDGAVTHWMPLPDVPLVTKPDLKTDWSEA